MLFHSVLLYFLGAAATAHSSSRRAAAPRSRCGTSNHTRANYKASERLAEEARMSTAIAIQFVKETLELNVYVHIFTDGQTAPTGRRLRRALDKQV